MTPVSSSVRVAVIGDRIARFAPQETIPLALEHSAAAVGCSVSVQWFTTPSLEQDADHLLASFDGIWCAPGGPYRSVEGAVNGIRVRASDPCRSLVRARDSSSAFWSARVTNSVPGTRTTPSSVTRPPVPSCSSTSCCVRSSARR